jgi:hypothetical protein
VFCQVDARGVDAADGTGRDQEILGETAGWRGNQVEVASAAPDQLPDQRHRWQPADPQRGAVGDEVGGFSELDEAHVAVQSGPSVPEVHGNHQREDDEEAAQLDSAEPNRGRDSGRKL